MRAAVLGTLVVSVAMAGCIEMPFGTSSAAALEASDYKTSVQSAVQSLSILFAQADESVRAFQQGWLAPEGAASEFLFLHDQVKVVKADITRARPPPELENFHRQLGRSVSLTQQAMDAMHVGFTSGDNTYFDLAHEKFSEARATLDRAVDAI